MGWIKERARKVNKRWKGFLFRHGGHDKALKYIFAMSDPDAVVNEASDLDFSTERFKELMGACPIKIVNRWNSDMWELEFNGKRRRIPVPSGNKVNITIIRRFKELLVEAGVKNPDMIYNFL